MYHKPQLTWGDICAQFVVKYTTKDRVSRLVDELHMLRNHALPDLQRYTDRYRSISQQLNYKDSEKVNIDMCERHMCAEVKKRLNNWRMHKMVHPTDPLYEFTSLRSGVRTSSSS